MVDYGTDLSGVLDLDPSGREVTGAECVAQCAARRILLPPIGDGPALADASGESGDAGTIARLQSQYRDVVLGDDRVQQADVRVTYDTGTQTLAVRVSGITAAGPFRLVMSAANAVAVVEEILIG